MDGIEIVGLLAATPCCASIYDTHSCLSILFNGSFQIAFGTWAISYVFWATTLYVEEYNDRAQLPLKKEYWIKPDWNHGL